MPPFNGEPRFPHAASAGERNQAIILEKTDDLLLFFLVTDKGRQQ